jgi:N-acyl-D-aspartate/D-glutamate deacylase
VYDLVITGGTLVDGTGAPRRAADVAVRDGRIARIDGPGALAGAEATRRIDAQGRVVAPGFVDPHTHYDAQLLWDPAATPSCLHGVTTVIGGNCGFTLAPLAPGDADFLRRMMARVEGMPLEALEHGLSWDWQSFGEYLDRLEGNVGVNAGFLVGHSAIRRLVMGVDATTRDATPGEIEAMEALLRDGLAAGGLGWSTSLSYSHNDGDNQPVPSRQAARDELLRLAAAVREVDGTTLEFITSGCLGRFSDDEIALMVDLTVTADRALNWNVLNIGTGASATQGHQLSAADAAAERGGRIVALAMPENGPSRLCFHDYFALFSLPVWKDVFGLDVPERTAAFAEPATRRALDEAATSPDAGALRGLARWAVLEIGATFAPENDGVAGRTVGDVAAERGVAPFDAMCDIAVADGLRTIFWTPVGTTSEMAAVRADVLRDQRVLIGGSDAGAHLDRMCGARYPTLFLAGLVREHGVVTLEDAVRLMTDVPARYFGLVDRGRVVEGGHADLVVFDPDTVDADRIVNVADLPGGAERLTSAAVGIDHVFVNGVPIVEHGAVTGARPGVVLRAGRDTAGTALSAHRTGAAGS